MDRRMDGRMEWNQYTPQQPWCAWRHQAITWTNVDLSSGQSSNNHIEDNFTSDTSATNNWNNLENYLYIKISLKYTRGQWVKYLQGQAP